MKMIKKIVNLKAQDKAHSIISHNDKNKNSQLFMIAFFNEDSNNNNNKLAD